MAVKYAGGKAVPTATRKYRLGDMYSSDFDYDGMLMMSQKALAGGMSVADMERLYDSMEDVNYHTQNRQLKAKIDEMKGGKGNPAALTQAIGKVVNDSLAGTSRAFFLLTEGTAAARKAESMISNSAADYAQEARKLYEQAQAIIKKADGLMVQAYAKGTNLGGK